MRGGLTLEMGVIRLYVGVKGQHGCGVRCKAEFSLGVMLTVRFEGKILLMAEHPVTQFTHFTVYSSRYEV